MAAEGVAAVGVAKEAAEVVAEVAAKGVEEERKAELGAESAC